MRAHLDRDDLTGLGSIELAPNGGTLPDAVAAARMVLADVADCARRERRGRACVSVTDWDELAAQVRCLQQAVRGRRAEQAANRPDPPESRPRDEARFEAALLGSPVIVFSQDTDLRYTWVFNPQLRFASET